jgi:hypothetical protein
LCDFRKSEVKVSAKVSFAQLFAEVGFQPLELRAPRKIDTGQGGDISDLVANLD